MKLCRYGGGRLGVVRGGRVHDVSGFLDTLPRHAWGGPLADPVFGQLDALRAWMIDHPSEPGPLVDDVRLEAPVPRPSKIIGAPVNYHAHLAEAEADRALHQGARVHRIDEVGLFLKASSALVGPGHVIALRHPERRLDHEAEVVVVIGRSGAHVSVEDAPELIAGYCLGLDLTLRGKEDRSMRKSGDGFAVVGPWVTTPEEISDPDAIPFSLTVNDEVRQSATSALLIRSVAELLSWASRFYTLHPGDLLFTGTPAGVAPLAYGDRLTVESPALGRLSVRVAPRPDVGAREAGARLLVAMALADGVLQAREVEMLGELCEGRGLDFVALCADARRHTEDALWFLRDTQLTNEERREALLDAMTLAFVDGDYAQSERALLQEAAGMFGLDDFFDRLPEFGDSLGQAAEALVHNRLLDIHNPYHRALAARLLPLQGCLAVQLSTTYALLTLAKPAHIEGINVHKGRGRDRVATLVVSPGVLPAVCAQVDAQRVHPDHRPMVLQHAPLRFLAGALLVRLPVVEGFTLLGQAGHAAFLSTDDEGAWVQVLCPTDAPTLALLRAAEARVGLLAATSMNDSSIDEPTIMEPRRALEFCQERDIGVALLDRPVSQGSFKILRFSSAGASVEREGRAVDVDALLESARARAAAPSP